MNTNEYLRYRDFTRALEKLIAIPYDHKEQIQIKKQEIWDTHKHFIIEDQSIQKIYG